MLEQHPVPQNVTNFQFKLVGDMTLKQFGYLAGGAILAYISYNLPLPIFFRWPLVGLFALGAIGFAFVPIEERPMDVWFLSFIKSIYSPTLYVWQREVQTIQTTQNATQQKPHVFPILKIVIPQKQPPALKAIASYFSSLPFKKNTKTQHNVAQNNIQTQTESQNNDNSSTPLTQNNQKLTESSQENKITTTINMTTGSHPPQTTNQTNDMQTQSNQNNNEASAKQKQEMIHPNMLQGFIKQRNGDAIQNILITVKNSENIPIRALKTDRAGRFYSPTPLPNGIYSIEAEDPKGLFFFQQHTITLQGKPIEPIIIYAKSKQDLERQKLEEALFGKKQ